MKTRNVILIALAIIAVCLSLATWSAPHLVAGLSKAFREEVFTSKVIDSILVVNPEIKKRARFSAYPTIGGLEMAEMIVEEKEGAHKQTYEMFVLSKQKYSSQELALTNDICPAGDLLMTEHRSSSYDFIYRQGVVVFPHKKVPFILGQLKAKKNEKSRNELYSQYVSPSSDHLVKLTIRSDGEQLEGEEIERFIAKLKGYIEDVK